MALIIFIVVVFLLIYSPLFRCAVSHPVKMVVNGAVDLYHYFKYLKFNNADYGFIKCYTAAAGYAFGSGKTLSVVHEIVQRYNQYNGKKVWCSRRKKYVTQRIFILSNVEFLTVPFVHMDSLKQFVGLSDTIDDYDDEHDTLTVIYALCDEASSQMNSRSYKDNFDPLFISTLLTSRHFRASFYLTSQKFFMVDKLMRSCVSTVYSTAKLWRFQRYSVYDAVELENATNELMIKPLKRGCWFITNKDYAAYDTHASVGMLKKACESGDMMSEAEILQMIGSTDSDVAAVSNFSRKYRRRHKKMN